MTPNLILNDKLSQAARRIRMLLVYQWAFRALCWTALACVLWLLASKLNWVSEPEPKTIAGILLMAALVGAIVGFTRRISTMDVARMTDRRTDMKDRLASAVEFQALTTDDPLLRRQVEDAGVHAKDVNVRRVYPVRMSKETVGFVVLALFLFGAFFLPTMPMFWSKEKKQEIEEVKKQGIQIEKIATDKQKAASDKKLEETKKAAKEAQKLAEAMKKGNMTKKTAMIQMAKLTKQMEEQQRRMAQANTPEKKSMQQAAAEAKKSLEQQQKAIEAAAQANKEKAKDGKNKTEAEKAADKANANKPGEKKNDKAGQSKEQSEAMKQIQQALQKFAQALSDQNNDKQNQAMQEIADQMEKGQMSQNEMQQLQQQMAQMAQALKGSQLDKAGQQMQQMAQMHQIKLDPETLKKLAKMMREAGGQCKGGAGNLDAKTLAELLQALKEGRLKLAMGGGGGGFPIPIPVKSPGKGKGQNGMGMPTKPLKGEVAGSPKMIAIGKNGGVSADSRASKEFLKYAAMGHKDSKYKPNSQIKGTWNQSHSELQQQFQGDPDGNYVASTPLYQAYQSGKRSLENPVNKENIPAAYRKQVKEYFESINPGK